MNPKYMTALEDAAGTVSSVTMNVEDARNALRLAASKHNKGFVPGPVNEAFASAQRALNALFEALNNAQNG